MKYLLILLALGLVLVSTRISANEIFSQNFLSNCSITLEIINRLQRSKPSTCLASSSKSEQIILGKWRYAGAPLPCIVDLEYKGLALKNHTCVVNEFAQYREMACYRTLPLSTVMAFKENWSEHAIELRKTLSEASSCDYSKIVEPAFMAGKLQGVTFDQVAKLEFGQVLTFGPSDPSFERVMQFYSKADPVIDWQMPTGIKPALEAILFQVYKEGSSRVYDNFTQYQMPPDIPKFGNRTLLTNKHLPHANLLVDELYSFSKSDGPNSFSQRILEFEVYPNPEWFDERTQNVDDYCSEEQNLSSWKKCVNQNVVGAFWDNIQQLEGVETYTMSDLAKLYPNGSHLVQQLVANIQVTTNQAMPYAYRERYENTNPRDVFQALLNSELLIKQLNNCGSGGLQMVQFLDNSLVFSSDQTGVVIVLSAMGNCGEEFTRNFNKSVEVTLKSIFGEVY